MRKQIFAENLPGAELVPKYVLTKASKDSVSKQDYGERNQFEFLKCINIFLTRYLMGLWKDFLNSTWQTLSVMKSNVS